MHQFIPLIAPHQNARLSRRTMLASATLAAASSFISRQSRTVAAEPEVDAKDKAPTANADLEPRNAIAAILDAMHRFPLVAIGEIHTLQEFHDFITALLFHPDLPGSITDIVVEFGNAQYQDVADRFVVEGQPVANADLERIWRHTVGGGVQLDAPVYGQFFRNVLRRQLDAPAGKKNPRDSRRSGVRLHQSQRRDRRLVLLLGGRQTRPAFRRRGRARSAQQAA